MVSGVAYLAKSGRGRKLEVVVETEMDRLYQPISGAKFLGRPYGYSERLPVRFHMVYMLFALIRLYLS